MLTPVDREGKVDHGALRQLVERLISRGVAGVSPLGSTGEGYSLGLDQRLAVVDTVAESVTAGMPVIPASSRTTTSRPSPRSPPTRTAAVRAVLVAPPGYYPLSAAEQEGYFSRLADAAALPLVMYNIPVYTKVQIAPAVAAALAPHPRVAGLKDSGMDLGYAARCSTRCGRQAPPRTSPCLPDGLDARLLHAGRSARHHLRERQRLCRAGARRVRRGQGGASLTTRSGLKPGSGRCRPRSASERRPRRTRRRSRAAAWASRARTAPAAPHGSRDRRAR